MYGAATCFDSPILAFQQDLDHIPRYTAELCHYCCSEPSRPKSIYKQLCLRFEQLSNVTRGHSLNASTPQCVSEGIAGGQILHALMGAIDAILHENPKVFF